MTAVPCPAAARAGFPVAECSPAPDDKALGISLVPRLRASSRARVCRVVMVGSRAIGVAGPSSDLDVLVIVETPGNSPRWRAGDVLHEAARMASCLPSTPVPIDLSVRTTDQLAEARHVVGSVEWLADRVGYTLFAQPPRRAPLPRVSPVGAKCQLVADWLRQAFDQAWKSRDAEFRSPDEAKLRSEKAVRAATMALLVWHQIESFKQEPLELVLSRLPEDDAPLGARILEMTRLAPGKVEAAMCVTELVRHRLQVEPYMLKYAPLDGMGDEPGSTRRPVGGSYFRYNFTGGERPGPVPSSQRGGGV